MDGWMEGSREGRFFEKSERKEKKEKKEINEKKANTLS